MKAVILAGGLGSRISEESHLRPKPMIEIGGKPIRWHIMKIYSTHGINDFVVCLGWREVWGLARVACTRCAGPDLGGGRNQTSARAGAIPVSSGNCKKESHSVRWQPSTGPLSSAEMAAGREPEVTFGQSGLKEPFAPTSAMASASDFCRSMGPTSFFPVLLRGGYRVPWRGPRRRNTMRTSL
jgi:MobA-like NTP transferase domain